MFSPIGHTLPDVAEVIFDGLQDSASGLGEFVGKATSAFAGFVDNDATVHDKEDAAWRRNGLTFIQPPCLCSKGEHGDVDTGRLAGGSRESNGVGPGRFA